MIDQSFYLLYQFPDSQEYNPQNSDIGLKNSISQQEHAAIVEKSLTQEPTATRLGEWEKYTNVISNIIFLFSVRIYIIPVN